MTVPINMALYRLLVKMGTPEGEAEEAATLDASALATTADLADIRTSIADLKSSLLMWIILLLIGQTGLLLTIIRAMRP